MTSGPAITAEMKADALREALKKLPSGHHGDPHHSGTFTYKPWCCPGCVYSVLRALLEEMGSR